MPAFVADENVPRLLIAALRSVPFEVISISETRPRIPDPTVLEEAFARGAVLITADNDFGELVFRHQEATAGVVLLRLHGLSPQARANLALAEIVRHQDRLMGAFTVITPGQVRIRPR